MGASSVVLGSFLTPLTHMVFGDGWNLLLGKVLASVAVKDGAAFRALLCGRISLYIMWPSSFSIEVVYAGDAPL